MCLNVLPQQQVKKWLYGEGSDQHAVLAGLRAAGSSARTTAAGSSPAAPQAAAAGADSTRRPSSGVASTPAAVDAVLGSIERELEQLQQEAGVASSVKSLPVQSGLNEGGVEAEAAAAARRRSRSLSPTMKGIRASSSAAGMLQQLEQLKQLTGSSPEHESGARCSSASLAMPDSGWSADPGAAAAAVHSQLQALASRSYAGE